MDPDHHGTAFLLQPADSDGSPRWVVGPPRDPHGDGIGMVFVSELHDDGLSVVAEVQVDGDGDGLNLRLPAFVERLAEDWRGWNGVRNWHSWDRDLFLDARHDGRRHVELGVTLRRYRPPFNATRWTARAVFHLEPGEEMARFAADLGAVLASPST